MAGATDFRVDEAPADPDFARAARRLVSVCVPLPVLVISIALPPEVAASSLKVEMGELISEIEILVSRSITGGGGFGGTPNTEPHPLMMQQIPADQRLPRATLAGIGDT